MAKHTRHPNDKDSLGGGKAGAAQFGSRGRGAVTGVLSSVTAAIPEVLNTGGPRCQGPSLHDEGPHRSPQPEQGCVSPSPHRWGCAGGPRPAPCRVACYSAQVRRWLMKLVPGELPHSSAERLINEASATAAGASAQGTGTGTARADRRTDRRMLGGSWCLSWPSRRSKAGDAAEQDTLTQSLCWRVWAGGSILPGDTGTLPWPGPTSLQTHQQDALILFSVSTATASFPSPFRQPDPLCHPPAAPSPASTHPPAGTQAVTRCCPLLWGLSWVAMPPTQHPRAAGPNPAPRWVILGEQLEQDRCGQGRHSTQHLFDTGNN